MSEQGIAPVKEMLVACELSEEAKQERKVEIVEDIWSGVEERRELQDGYEYRFPGTDTWAERLGQFIRFERKCCRFLLFELVFEQDEGPVWLRLRGGPGTKEFLETV